MSMLTIIETQGLGPTSLYKCLSTLVFIYVCHFVRDNARNKKSASLLQNWRVKRVSQQRQNAPKCTKLNIHFQKFSGGDTPGPPFSLGGEG